MYIWYNKPIDIYRNEGQSCETYVYFKHIENAENNIE